MRTERVGQSIREVLAEEIARLEDPGLGLVSITNVRVSGDLRHATVFFSVLDPNTDVESTADALRRARKRLQSSIGSQLRMKRTPVLSFELDEAVIVGERIDRILRDLPETGDEEMPDPGGGPGEETGS